ncbi:hypothetical protein Taro_009069 [Colocasia esculenta]|uniref:Dof zinc finger protein n=1 Tax=Colocasia esculenta TaxID=4460 RepID=A0A843U404_COLES|nr:hypothetical protein [Colocasia esculenta]
MMASEAAGDDVHGPGGKTADAAGGGSGAVRPPEQGLKCPRCDSPNTKFCYYNNYSLAQPRYFCKTCRRYWTKGGALRNVPVGGGCRKSKKSKSSSSAASAARLSSDGPAQELRLYQLGLPPAVDFHLGGGAGLPFSRLHHPSAAGPGGVFNGAATDGAAANHLISFGDLSCSAAALPAEAAGATPAPLLGFSYPIQAVASSPFIDMGVGAAGDATTPGTNLATMHSNLAVSIESLSSINQGLHWKLQQQRLAMFFGGDQSQQQHPGKGGSDPAATAALPAALLEGTNRHMSCHMPASSKEMCATAAAATAGVSTKGSMVGDATSSTTEWFLDNSTTYTAPNAHISLNSSGNAASSNWNGIQAWNDMHQFSALP